MILEPDHLSYLSDQTIIIDAISSRQLILIQPVHNSENFHIYQSGVLSTFLLYLDYHWKWMTEKIISIHFAQGALMTVRTGGSTLAIDIGYAGEMVTRLEKFSATETMSAGKMTSAIGQNSHVWTMKSLVSKIIKEV